MPINYEKTSEENELEVAEDSGFYYYVNFYYAIPWCYSSFVRITRENVWLIWFRTQKNTYIKQGRNKLKTVSAQAIFINFAVFPTVQQMQKNNIAATGQKFEVKNVLDVLSTD